MAVILASTRQGRFGDRIIGWLMPILAARSDMSAELVDLRDWQLPYYDRPSVAAASEYDDSAMAWAEVVGRADGFIIVTPEYNYGYPAVLKSALDAVYREWNRKPVAFVSYGGWSGGSRAVQQIREVCIELQMAPIRSGVVFQFAPRAFGEDGQPKDPALFGGAATRMLDDLAWWLSALGEARARPA